jgi:hypothetical protein
MNEPTTEAGRVYLLGVERGYTAPRARAEEAIPAIEREARRAALLALRERVERLTWTVDQSYRASTDEVRLQAARVSRAAVIAEINRALEP